MQKSGIWILSIFFLLLLPNPNKYLPRPVDSSLEEIQIYFHCRPSGYLQNPTVQEFLEIKRDQLMKEGGNLYFFTFPHEENLSNREKTEADKINSTQEEWDKETQKPQIHPKNQSYRFKNGRFLWSADSWEPDSKEDPNEKNGFSNMASYQFVIQRGPKNYQDWKDYNSASTRLFWIVSESIPNGYRFRGNVHTISCPKRNDRLGKISLSFRGNRLIRHHYELVNLQNWRGDL